MPIKWKTNQIASFLVVNIAIAVNHNKAIAQSIVPDNTLGEESSNVTPNVEINGVESDRIEGGAQRGANLFHSFSEFNVQNGRGVYFANPAGIENILGRVTGNGASEILGTLGVQGNANLFLINPNGITFGENARLDMGGSFYGSTADSILFPNGVEFSATDTQTEPLLTINVPIGLGLGNNPGEIVNRSVNNGFGLSVLEGESIALIGGNVSIENGGIVFAPGGRIELGGLIEAGIVEIADDGSFNFPENIARGNVSLSNSSIVAVFSGGGGSIGINAQSFNLISGSRLLGGILAEMGSADARAGDIVIDAVENVAIDGRGSDNFTGILNRVYENGIGSSGNIKITTTSLTLNNGGGLSANLSGQGNAGNIIVDANEVSLEGQGNSSTGFFNRVTETGVGNAGNIDITTGSLTVSNQASLDATSSGRGNAGSVTVNASDSIAIEGNDPDSPNTEINVSSSTSRNAGNIELNTASLTLNNEAGLYTINTENGRAGNVTINATKDVSFRNLSRISVVGAEGGSIQLNAKNLSLTAGSVFLAGIDSSSSEAQAGDIDINLQEDLIIDGLDSNENLTFITNSSFGGGNPGNISVSARNITFQNDGNIGIIVPIDEEQESVNIGSITLNATGDIVFDGGTNSSASGLFNFIPKNSGGSIGEINVTAQNLTITNGARIQSSVSGNGDSGNINIDIANSIEIDGFSSNISSVIFSPGTGNTGDINIKTQNLELSRNGYIGAELGGEGNSGNININAKQIFIGEQGNSDLRPSYIGANNLGKGNGGDITIDTGSLFISDGGHISADIFVKNGNGGNITIKATDTISVNGTGLFKNELVFSYISADISNSTGNAGDIEIDTAKLLIDKASISADVLNSSPESESSGNGGSIIIRASELVEVSGSSSSISAIVDENVTGNAGDLIIETEKLTVNDSQISVGTFGEGNAGNLTVRATDSIELKGFSEEAGRSGLFANALVGSGNGGNLSVFTDELVIRNGATITASNFPSIEGITKPGTGQPGNITIEANSIELINRGRIEAATQSTISEGANINLQVANLITLRNNSFISARAFEDANGGNLTINTDFIIASPSSGGGNDIIASAVRGNGGNININAADLFGLAQSDSLTDGNDISASSELGVEGNVEINTPEVDRNKELVELPTAPLESEIVRTCALSEEEQSEFVIPGRGGLPPTPEDIESDSVAVDWITRPPQNIEESTPEISTDSATPEPIIEAQGWVVDQNDEIVLIAQNPNNSWQNIPQCQESSGVGGQESEVQNHSLLSNDTEQNILIASTSPPSLTASVPERISVESFDIKGNTVFEEEELSSLLAPYTNKSLSFTELLQARTAITDYYTQQGYITSGAYLPLQRLQDEVVTIQVVEGYLEDIEITGNKRLNDNYVSSRISTATKDSLQQEELLAALQLLQQDPLISNLSAQLEIGTRPGASVLEVEINEANSFSTPVLLDNRRAPSVGSFRRQFALDEGNLLGMGDNLFLAYSNTEGSDAFDGSYGFPFNANNGTITIRGGVSGSEVIEEPFNQLNILGDSHYYELSLRQPILQTPSQEFAIGITASRRNSDISSLLDRFDVPPSELSSGADEDGQTQVSALRFFQEWTSRSDNQVIAARSQFNLGLGIFDATVNEDAPDSRFLAWQGQAQWTRRLAEDTLFLLRGGIQLATTSLLPSEQFGLGGLETVRGYRQDLRLTDNAAFATAEFRLPLFRIRSINSVLGLAPFIDVGLAWNNGSEDRDVLGSNALASVGLGLRLSLFNSFTARFDWGIPLVAIDTESNTWQENGLYFSIEYSPF